MGDLLYQILIKHVADEKENYIKIATKQINDLIITIEKFGK
jgi:hypothetical protein